MLLAAQRRAEALAARDAVALTRLLHPDFVWTTHKGDVMDVHRYVLANTTAGGDLRWLGQTLEQPSVVVVGDAAVLTAVVVDLVEKEGVSRSFRLRMTQTWVRNENGWRCLAGHASSMAETA